MDNAIQISDLNRAESYFSMINEGNRTNRCIPRFFMQIYPFALLLVDLLLIDLIFGLMVALRYDVHLFDAMSRRVILTIIAPSVLGMYIVGGYNYATDKFKYRFISEYLIMAVAVGLSVFLVLYSVVAYGANINSSRLIVAATLIVFPVLALAYRTFLTKLQRKYEERAAICIIGAGERAQDVYKRLRASHANREIIVLRVGDDTSKHRLIEECEESPVIESLDILNGYSERRKKHIESYVVTVDIDQLPEVVSKKLVCALFSGDWVYSYEDYLEHQFRIISPEQLSARWPLQQGFGLCRSVAYDRLKRIADIATGLCGIVVALPVMLLTAIAVKMTSRGPVFFKQERTGHRQKPFMIYKFRSMTVGSEAGDKYTSKNDVRLTSIGKFIRKTRLDELPQFWNVLKGDLSLIGPRPEWVDLVNRYEKIFPFYHFRHAVKPGLTGWAQVNYSYGANNEDTRQKLYYDLYYVRRYSITLDLTIVIKTIYMMIFGKGQ